jgi:hypothetical protein
LPPSWVSLPDTKQSGESLVFRIITFCRRLQYIYHLPYLYRRSVSRSEFGSKGQRSDPQKRVGRIASSVAPAGAIDVASLLHRGHSMFASAGFTAYGKRTDIASITNSTHSSTVQESFLSRHSGEMNILTWISGLWLQYQCSPPIS